MPPSKKHRRDPARRQLAAGDDGEKLLAAAVKGNGEEVARLLAAGANPNTSQNRDQTTPLCLTVVNGRLEATRLRLDGGADPNRSTSNGFTPLMIAAANSHLEILRLLLGRGAALDAAQPGIGRTAFHIACINNQPDCAEAMIEAGSDVDLKDCNGETGFELAERQGHAAFRELKLRLKVTEGLVDRLRAAQATACPELQPAPEPELKLTDAAGPGAADLVSAAMNGDGAAVARLLSAGTDANAWVATRRNPTAEWHHTTPLWAAACYGHLGAARLLLDGGADPSHAGYKSETPLMQAATKGYLEVLRLLLAWGAAVDATSTEKYVTAFHLACLYNHAGCVEALARAGCDDGLKTKNGLTGREIAEKQGSKDAARRLRALARQPFVGVLVELAGLVGAADHNGKRATVRLRDLCLGGLIL
jgi:ankyrin repeat protein